MLDTMLLILILGSAVAILVVAGALLVAIKAGFGQVVAALQAIYDRP